MTTADATAAASRAPTTARSSLPAPPTPDPTRPASPLTPSPSTARDERGVILQDPALRETARAATASAAASAQATRAHRQIEIASRGSDGRTPVSFPAPTERGLHVSRDGRVVSFSVDEGDNYVHDMIARSTWRTSGPVLELSADGRVAIHDPDGRYHRSVMGVDRAYSMIEDLKCSENDGQCYLGNTTSDGNRLVYMRTLTGTCWPGKVFCDGVYLYDFRADTHTRLFTPSGGVSTWNVNISGDGSTVAMELRGIPRSMGIIGLATVRLPASTVGAENVRATICPQEALWCSSDPLLLDENGVNVAYGPPAYKEGDKYRGLTIWSPISVLSRSLPQKEVVPTLTAGNAVIYSMKYTPGVYRSRCWSLTC
ncbi:hypothetical protein AB0395_06610 [Streptosporangium sp. NPDC051023]|uniref:hypothetical protein n=1 Tax=Streptosporangium sp. NPDC051023 TaxID=3155410 RepID=UPI003450C0A2